MENQNQQPQIPIQEPVSTPISRPAPKLQNNSALVILSILLIIMVGILAFLAYQNFQLQKQISLLTAATSTPQPTPVATVDPTVNWKTFVDNNTGLTFKYPQRLSLPIPQVAGMAIPEGEFALNDSTSGSNHPFTIDMIKYNGDLVSFTKKYTNYESASKLQMTNLNLSSPLGDLVSNSNGLAIYKYINTYDQTVNPGAKDVINYKAIFILKNYGFIVSSSNTIDTLSEFSQILSTFKFLGASPSPTCKPRPACLDATPRCLMPETSDMCPPPSPVAKACTMEAKICPDGSSVGRSGPNCEFAPCPTSGY